MERKKYPIRAEDYELYEMVGQGVSASVYRARCVPFNEVVAIKILDFEKNNSDLNRITREAQIMILIDHPNVLKAHCSFVNDHNLWVIMPYMAGGSCLHIMKSVYPNGFEEVVIATVLREALKGLEYLHHHGHIHRDVKLMHVAELSLGILGSLLAFLILVIGSARGIQLMAPEVMEQRNGYDFKADIWSFGITALELAHGHAPFSKYPPMKVFLMTLQNAPPGLDYERDRKFSRHFKQMVAMCLVKDPSKRPTAHKLLKQPFFKQARSQDFISRRILEGLPTLGDQYQALKDKEEDLLAQKKMPDGEKEEISQNEYNRGISSWNFDIEDLKAQASLIPDNEDTVSGKDSEGCASSLFEIDTLQERVPENLSLYTSCSLKYKADMENDVMADCKSTFSSPDQATCFKRAKSDGSDSEVSDTSGQNGLLLNDNHRKGTVAESREQEVDGKGLEDLSPHSSHERKLSTSSCSSDNFPPSAKVESLKQHNHLHNMGKCNGGTFRGVDEVSAEARTKASKPAALNADDFDDRSKPPVIQQRGRFKVTSEHVDLDKALPPVGLQKSHSMQVISQIPAISIPSSSDAASTFLCCSIFAQLHNMLQANILQRDNILSLMKQLTTSSLSPVSVASATSSTDGLSPSLHASVVEKSLLEVAQEREKELIQDVTDLQYRLICAHEEIQRLKARNSQV
ncbi:uncharacterized protein [Typha latifolia]|uniref:uncharacterized protein isoform X2 n=1 Tax=Typha latifolia TaxID=4733 RepID=UPI003C2DFDFE